MVVAGCEGEVHIYSLFVDDTAQTGRQAVATARQALSAGEALPQVGETAAVLLVSIHLMSACKQTKHVSDRHLISLS